MTVRLGIIGAGAIGEKHVQAANEAGISVAIVTDPQGDRAEELAKTCDAKASAVPDDVLTHSDVTAVVIGVPNKFHHPLAIQAMRAGKDVLLEKPMGLNLAECKEMNQVAAENQRILQVGLVHRYTQVGRKAQQMVAAGEVGEVYHAKAHLYCRRSVPGLGRWFTTKAIAGGGTLIDLGPHLLDLALFVLGVSTAHLVARPNLQQLWTTDGGLCLRKHVGRSTQL